ncbi:MAG: sugar ABC transporter substrate-binding protein [Betaproteobacteria bacterium]
MVRDVLAAGTFLAAIACSAIAQSPGQGIDVPIKLQPFQEGLPACTPPPKLARSLVFAQDNERQFMQGVSKGLEQAADERGLGYRAVNASDNASKMLDEVRNAVEQRVGAMVVAPVEPRSLAPAVQELIGTGAYVGSVVPPPAISILNAPQYLTGKVLGDSAANYISTHFAGKANVVLLTHDSLEPLAQRFVAIRDSLSKLPDVNIIADISPATVNKSGGSVTMNTILLAQSKIDVVLGADTVVLGALQALRAAGLARADQFLGGIDGEPEAIAEIKSGGPYKVTVSLASPIFGYAMGQHAADWLEGKVIPQAMDILPSALTADTVAAYEADVADPATVFADAKRRDRYLRMYGGICYDTRDRFLNFNWSSERNN